MKNPIFSYIKEVKNEAYKVSWPSREKTIRLTGIVVVISSIVALYLGVLDYLLNLVLKVVLVR